MFQIIKVNDIAMDECKGGLPNRRHMLTRNSRESIFDSCTKELLDSPPSTLCVFCNRVVILLLVSVCSNFLGANALG